MFILYIMAKKSNFFLKLGSVLGNLKKKDKDLFDAWSDLCAAMEVSTIDRMQQLMAWDLETGGVNLKRAGAVKKAMELGKQEQEIDHMKELSEIAKQAILDNVKLQQDFSQQLSAMLQNYNSQFISLQKAMQEITNQLQMIQEQRKLLEQEAVRLDMKERELIEREKKLKRKKE